MKMTESKAYGVYVKQTTDGGWLVKAGDKVIANLYPSEKELAYKMKAAIDACYTKAD
jgi:hypothetical protein